MRNQRKGELGFREPKNPETLQFSAKNCNLRSQLLKQNDLPVIPKSMPQSPESSFNVHSTPKTTAAAAKRPLCTNKRKSGPLKRAEEQLGEGWSTGRLLIHGGAFNLSLLLRKERGAGTPRGLAAEKEAFNSLWEAVRRLLSARRTRWFRLWPRLANGSFRLDWQPRIFGRARTA